MMNVRSTVRGCLKRDRREGRLFVGLAVAFCLLAGTSFADDAATTGTRPNILWISCEDTSPRYLPMYGDSTITMPSLAALASEGCVYDRAFATSPVCSPSRSTIITGIYAASLGTQNHRSRVKIPADVHCFPAYLRKAGYFCTNNAKTDYNFYVPEDAWDENSKTAHWRDRPRKDQPFFAVFNLEATHESTTMMPDRKFNKRVKDVPPSRRVRPDQVKLPPYIPDTPVTRKDWAKMYTAIEEMDIQAGKILDQLAADGLATNTLVCFFSDHGQGLPRGKRWLYDAGIRVSFIVCWPGHIQPGTRNGDLMSFVDLAPTMLTLAGVKPPKNMQGRVFLGEEKQPATKYIFATRDRMDESFDMARAVRNQRFKYIRNFYPAIPRDLVIRYLERNPTMQELRRLHKEGKLSGPALWFFQNPKPVEEFYDTKTDPFEIHNLADDPAQSKRVNDMRNALTAWQIRIRDKGFLPELPGNIFVSGKKKTREK